MTTDCIRYLFPDPDSTELERKFPQGTNGIMLRMAPKATRDFRKKRRPSFFWGTLLGGGGALAAGLTGGVVGRFGD